MCGDVTITWDETNKDKIIAMVRQKMEEGYSFFTTKKVPLLPLYRKVKVKSENLENMNSLVITDDEFERMTKSLDDKALAKGLVDGELLLAKRGDDKSEYKEARRIKDPEEVVENQSVALKPLLGG
jgi:hypothetical protein